MQLHHLSGEQGEQALRDSQIWDDIEDAIREKRETMPNNAMAIISVLAPSEDETMIVLVDGLMWMHEYKLNVLVLDDIQPEEWADSMFLMEKLRKNKALDSQRVLLQCGGLPYGMKKPVNPSLN
jgi:hypothetical protein